MRSDRFSLSLHERWILRSALEILMHTDGYGPEGKLVNEIGKEVIMQLREKLSDAELKE